MSSIRQPPGTDGLWRLKEQLDFKLVLETTIELMDEGWTDELFDDLYRSAYCITVIKQQLPYCEALRDTVVSQVGFVRGVPRYEMERRVQLVNDVFLYLNTYLKRAGVPTVGEAVMQRQAEFRTAYYTARRAITQVNACGCYEHLDANVTELICAAAVAAAATPPVDDVPGLATTSGTCSGGSYGI